MVITNFTVVDYYDEDKMLEYFKSMDTKTCKRYYEAYCSYHHDIILSQED